jgi:hypothetical protein
VKALAEPTEVLNLNVSSKTATSITLSWSPPAEGPSSVEDYLFRYSSNGTTWSSPLGITTSTTATVSGLNRGQTYYFQVAARNSIGNGPWQSSVFTAVPAVLPSAPVALAVSSKTATAVNLAWASPDNGGQSISDYAIQYSTDGINWTTTNDGVSATISISRGRSNS